jgi:hypothetical protein
MCYTATVHNKIKGDKMTEKVTKLVGAQVEMDLYKFLRNLAKSQDRSIASIIRMAILKFVRDHGF